MAMESTHKRSKSSVKSLLHKVSSRGDQTSPTPVPEASSGLPSAVPALQHSASTASSHRNSRHRPHLSTTMSNTAATVDNVIPEAHEPVTSPTSPITKGASIEQSVKLFKIFGALRNGDTTAISKAIREQAEAAASSNSPVQSGSATKLEGTTILHLAIQCADLSVIEFILSMAGSGSEGYVDVNARDRDGNTPLHLAATLGRAPVVKMLLDQPGIIDSIANYQGQTPLDLARTPDIFQQLQLARSIFIDTNVRKIHELVAAGDVEGLEALLQDQRIRSTIDVNGGELATDPATVETGGTLLHEAARKRDFKLIQMLLLNGADPFRRDRKGKLPQDVTKDDRTRAILKKSPAAAAAQRGIQEKTILAGAAPQSGPAASEHALGSKESREMKGYLKKWTNYTSGYKLRWFVLEDGVLSYYKHQDDAGSACRGAINMKIAKLYMDPQDKCRFEIQGKSSVKYHLKANHQVEAKRWYWALNNAIQWCKDEAKEEEKRQKQENEALKQAKMEQLQQPQSADSASVSSSKMGGRGLVPSTSLSVPNNGSRLSTSIQGASTADDDEFGASAYDPSIAGAEMGKMVSRVGTTTIEGDVDDDDEYGDDASSREVKPQAKDAFNIAAQSVKLQLDILSDVAAGLNSQKAANPTLPIGDANIAEVLTAYEGAVGNLRGLVGDLLRISRDRDAYWQYRLEREANIRRMWEESMAKVAREQEELEAKIGESEEKRKRTKRALRDALEGQTSRPASRAASRGPVSEDLAKETEDLKAEDDAAAAAIKRKKSILTDYTSLSESDSDDEEFFDAVGAGEVQVVEMPVSSPPLKPEELEEETDVYKKRLHELEPAFKGYEDGPRQRLKLAADDRPKISLWGVLKSMIGKDMTKMTLPVSFNEPTSLLQRIAEDMEYTDLLDSAADRADSTERMVYVAAFAASEYASTIGRIAKPFNPLLGETYEYARPDKGYRFFIEQVSHHPPIGAAYAEAPKWDYWGESAVRSKFYGKSFDINHLGTWFLRLRPTYLGGTESELYTWKKVSASVVGIITGNPTVDNYGPMEIKNWKTGDVCHLDFKPRGWKASSAYHVTGKVMDKNGHVRWSIGGRWNDKIYARLTPGYEDATLDASGPQHTGAGSSQAFLVWQANPRPSGIPFNLTPFGVTLNDLPERLKPILAPTDTRWRPDQRAMEDGEYDRAATEKNRVEEKQRAKRREREAKGEVFVPRWFTKKVDEVTGAEYWDFNREYWTMRERVANDEGTWEGLEDIF